MCEGSLLIGDKGSFSSVGLTAGEPGFTDNVGGLGGSTSLTGAAVRSRSAALAPWLLSLSGICAAPVTGAQIHRPKHNTVNRRSRMFTPPLGRTVQPACHVSQTCTEICERARVAAQFACGFSHFRRMINEP